MQSQKTSYRICILWCHSFLALIILAYYWLRANVSLILPSSPSKGAGVSATLADCSSLDRQSVMYGALWCYSDVRRAVISTLMTLALRIFRRVVLWKLHSNLHPCHWRVSINPLSTVLGETVKPEFSSLFVTLYFAQTHSHHLLFLWL